MTTAVDMGASEWKSRAGQQAIEPSSGDGRNRKSMSFYMTFFALNICVLLVSLDATALSVMVPVITHSLHGTTLEAFWVSLCFLLAVVAVMPLINSLSDAIGRKIPLQASFILFVVGSIVFAVAQDMGVLILGRTLQGLGGGGLDVLGEVILADITTLKERPFYLGIFSIPMAGGAICGPIVGAALAEYASWRWIGWINVPLGVIGLAISHFFLRLKPLENTLAYKLARLDWIGMFFYLSGIALFTLPLSWAGSLYPWTSYQTLLPLLLGLILLIVLGIYEAKPAQPVFPYRIFKTWTANATLIGAFTHGAVLNGGLLYLLLSFQATFLDTPFRAAVEVLPICVFIVVFSIFGAVSVEVIRKYKWLIIAAWPCLAIGVGLFPLWKPGSSDGLKYGPQVLAGIGLGTLFTICTFPMNASQLVDDAGLSIGIMVSCRMFGSAVGLAIGSTTFNSVFKGRIDSIGQLPNELAVLYDVREAVGFIPQLRSLDASVPAYDDVINAYRDSFKAVFLALAALGVVGFVSSLLIKDISLENDEVGRQGLEGI